MQTGSSDLEKPLWDQMEGAWLWTLDFAKRDQRKPVLLGLSLVGLMGIMLSALGADTIAEVKLLISSFLC
jgi:hypothetical protein